MGLLEKNVSNLSFEIVLEAIKFTTAHKDNFCVVLFIILTLSIGDKA